MTRHASPQLELVLDLGTARCSLCGRKVERRCKWCFKGGGGDPPMPEMRAWKTWQTGLKRTLRAALERTGFAATLVRQTIEAVFYDHGNVPVETAPLAQPYLERSCSVGRYERAREQCVLQHHIFLALFETYGPKARKSIVERAKGLARDELVDLLHVDREEDEENAARSRHLQDVASVATEAIVRLRRAGVTPEQRGRSEVVGMAVQAVGLTPLRWKPGMVERIACAIVDDELAKRRARARIAGGSEPAVKLRIADEVAASIAAEIETLADDEARSFAKADPRARRCET